MSYPTWGELVDGHCSQPYLSHPNEERQNPWFEHMANRRYNYAPSTDVDACRLVFLKEAASDHSYRTLRRDGRFIWCKNLHYEGRNADGYRQVSFTVDKGSKRFVVSENNILCLPSKNYVGNNKYFRRKLGLFKPFSTVFGYKRSFTMLRKNGNYTERELSQVLRQDSPYKPGTLVAPRMGYFFPEPFSSERVNDEHPCGIVLGPSFADDYLGKEFYRVRFGDTTYEQVHPVQLEILNEV